MLDIPVLISGGGPVGLMASLLLSQHGVRSLLVERHPSTAITPKARGINARTMELFRQCGIDDAVREAGLQEGRMGLIVWTETLAGTEIERRVPGRATSKNMAMTPVKNCLCAQDDLEPVIRRFAEAAGPGTLRFNTELTSFSQKPGGGVTGLLTDRATGAETPFTARYLIACEGAQSRVRRALAVKMVGEEKVYDSVNILCHADLTQWVEHRPAALYFVELDDLRATFLTINGRDRWGFLIHGPKQYGWKPQDFTPEFCAELIRKGAGAAGPRRDRARRQPLGSLSHRCRSLSRRRRLPGRRCGARDAADRRFWLEHRGAGRSKPDVENRGGAARQGGRRAARQLSRRTRSRYCTIVTEERIGQRAVDGTHGAASQKSLPRQQFLNEQGLIFGARYDSTAIVPDGTPPVIVEIPSPNIFLPLCPAAARLTSGCERGHEQISTIDLFGSALRAAGRQRRHAWRKAAQSIGKRSWPPLARLYRRQQWRQLSDPDGKLA